MPPFLLLFFFFATSAGGTSLSEYSTMGRDKRKKKVPTHDDDSSNDEIHHPSESVQLENGEHEGSEERENNGGGKIGDATTTSQTEESNIESQEPKSCLKKKEYKGNKIRRQAGGEGEGGKKKGKLHSESVGDGGTSGQEESEKVGTDREDELIVVREYPVEVLYCPVCTFPAEMCEFSGMLEKCRPWLLEHAAELADAEEKGRKRRILTEKGRLEKLLEGGAGPKHVITRNVIVELEEQSNKRTIVTGMDLFGFNLKDLSREWRKMFSAGVGVRKGEEMHEQSRLEIQGNVMAQLGKLFESKYNIPKESVLKVVKESGSKKKTVNFYE